MPRASGPRWASFAAMAPAIASSSCVPGRRSSSRKPAMPHMRSHRYLHAIIGDFPTSRRSRGTLAGIFAQRRIRVVDVDVDLASDIERLKLLEPAVMARHVHMAYALASLVEKPLGNHFIIGVERAVKKDERRSPESRTQRIVKSRAAGNEEEIAPGG